jgi:Tol biopolymer transport system component/predicted Ser/Thr protein kinase
MKLPAGTRLGPYEIVETLGVGGMGEVYKARDARLGRDVAIKVLPEALSADAEGLRRFETEARAASSLNHPNIVTVYDIGESAGTSFIAMEMVDGRTLRELLADGPVPTKRLLQVASQVADGLAKAHGAGIVHRDLKPENVMVTRDGFVKILDFGLAKLTQPEAPDGESQARTVSGATATGVVMGTAGYMSPEQAAGKPLDFRSDQFSFGSIVYEMATGKRAFARDSFPETLVAIIHDEPESITKLNALSPAPLRWIVERCLAKNPDGRYAATRDLAQDLAALKDRLAETGGGAVPTGRPSFGPRWLVGLTAAGFLAAAAFAALYALRRAPAAPAEPVRFEIRAPEEARFAWAPMQNLFALSPDGRRIAFAARRSDGQSSLWVRPLAGLSAAALAGTDGAAAPFWSPDSRFIAFFADGKLKKVDAAGGQPVTLCDVTGAFPSGSWGSEHSILFAGLTQPVVNLVSESGGAPRAVLKADASRQEVSVCWPSFLPDGRHFLYVGRSEAEKQTYVRVASLEDPRTAPLLMNCSRAQYVPGQPNGGARGRSGHLLYARDGGLLAQPFDAGRLRLAEGAVPLGQEVFQHALIGTGPFSASDNGVLASRGKAGPTRLAWIDRDGRETASLASKAQFRSVRISPDSQQVLVGEVDPRTGMGNLWIGDLSREVLTRLDLGSNDYNLGIWSPDGTRIAFSVGSMRHPPSLYELALHGSSTPEPILPPGGIQHAEDWSADGRFLLYFSARTEADSGLWVLNPDGEPKPHKLLSEGETTEMTQAQFSPDGHWIAYCAPESGRSEVFLTSFPEPGERVRVSASGGSRPRWKRDGSELYFVSTSDEMTATAVRLGSSVQVGTSRPLFSMGPAGWQDYDVTADGQRFLVVVNMPAPDADAISMTVNWLSLLGR